MTATKADATTVSAYSPVAAPGPSVREMVSQMRHVRRDTCGWMMQTALRYGDMVALPLRKPPVVLVNSPSLAHDVLVRQADDFDKNTIQYLTLAEITGVGLLTSSGDAWRNVHRVVRPAFARNRMDNVGQVAVQVAARLAVQWERRGVADAEAMCLQASMGVISATVLDEGTGANDYQELAAAVLEALDAVVDRAHLPVPAWVPSRGNRAITKANRVLDETCRRLVTDARERPESVSADSVLGLLLAAQDAGELTAQQVRDELVTMIVAGHETVATAMTWTLGLLATHHGAQVRLRRELDEVVGDRPVTPADAAKLPWTVAVVRESLRLYPPAWVMSRRALRELSIGGRQIPAGTLMVISPWVTHRRDELFNVPERFDPERFMNKLSSVQRAAYMPFGAGKRVCIGKDFALVELVMMVAELLRQHRVVPARRGAPLPSAASKVTVRPVGGMPLALVHRDAKEVW